MANINTVNEGDIVEQNGDYAIVKITNDQKWYASIDENLMSEEEVDSAIHVCDMDEEHYTN